MSVARYFCESYRLARERFVGAVAAAGGEVASYVNPAGLGPEGEELATDVALFGSPLAPHLLIVISGTHGVEGFCGAGSQIAYLEEGRLEPADARTAVLLVHAINPYGFAWLRRVNEDNVDLNRNSIDHAQPAPLNPEYAALHGALVPRDWHGPDYARASAALIEYRRARGERALQAAISGGQYSHPDGLFYGGRALTWSTRTFHDILIRFAAGKKHIALLDFHTGLGPSGYGEPMCTQADAATLSRVVAWYGSEVRSVHRGESSSAVVSGPLIDAVGWSIPEADVTPLALEFGTQPLERVLEALRGEQWLQLHGDASSPEGRAIKRAMRDCFYVDSDAWKEQVVVRAREFLDKAYAGLASLPA